MRDSLPLEELIARARRRAVCNLLLAQAAIALSTAIGGVLALLVVGTQILDWPWVVFLFLGGLSFGTIRTLRRLPSCYETAQRVDHVLSLKDTISTAFFFRHLAPVTRASGDVVKAQERRAEEIARGIEPGSAVPLAAPRALYATGLLVVAAAGLFGLRYLLTSSLDLRPPIVQAAVFDVFRSVPRDTASLGKLPRRAARPGTVDLPGATLEDAKGRQTAAASQGDDSSSPLYERGQNAPGLPQPEEISVPGAEGSEDSAGDSTSALDPSPSQSGDGPSKAQSASKSENSSLMNKLRDAMADLLARLKMQPPNGEARTSSDTQEGLRAGQKKQGPGQKGDPGGEKQQAAGSSGEEADRNGEGNSQGARGKSGDRAAGQRGSGEERSGMGKEEGSKELRDAEQLAAMGKISEIIGKRAANMTGEAMVEVRSSREQSLKTPYAAREATHSEVGGEIHRDEIPLIFQSYVERYFEQVRKAPPAP